MKDKLCQKNGLVALETSLKILTVTFISNTTYQKVQVIIFQKFLGWQSFLWSLYVFNLLSKFH